MRKLWLLLVLGTSVLSMAASASTCVVSSDPQTLGQMLCNIKLNTFQGVFKLIFVFAYVSGMGLMVAAVFKLKQVKENPTQIPVSTPMALFVCAALLLYLPEVIVPAGETIFGSSVPDPELSEAASNASSIGVNSITNLMGSD